MTLSDLLKPEAVLVPLSAESREAAIAALVEALRLNGGPAAAESLRAAVLAREAAGSTGLGNGVAIPHARSAALAAPRLAVGRTSKPIDFKAADGKPVSLVFLLAVPEADPKSHLKALAALSRVASDKKLLKSLGKAATAAELFPLLAPVAV